ncbi:hypothetical protein ACQZV8_10965 [Magnetococcales bacterium HHB-1]
MLHFFRQIHSQDFLEASTARIEQLLKHQSDKTDPSFVSLQRRQDYIQYQLDEIDAMLNMQAKIDQNLLSNKESAIDIVELFKEFWDASILSIAKNKIKLHSDLIKLSADINESKKRVFWRFIENCIVLLDQMEEVEDEPPSMDYIRRHLAKIIPVLDRHKISASIILALLEEAPEMIIYTEKAYNEEVDQTVFYCRELFALRSGLDIMRYLFLNDDSLYTERSEGHLRFATAFLKAFKDYYIPRTSSGRGDAGVDILKSFHIIMAKCQNRKNSLDDLVLLLFFIEARTNAEGVKEYYRLKLASG